MTNHENVEDLGRGNTGTVYMDEQFEGGTANDGVVTDMSDDRDLASTDGTEAVNEDEMTGSEEVSTSEQETSLLDFGEMADAIDSIGKVLEMQRKVVNTKDELAYACYQFGISEDDQNVIHNHMKEFVKGKGSLKKVTKTKKSLDDAFFTRTNGSVIKIENPLEKTNNNAPGSFNEFEVKKSLILYIEGYYRFEADVQKDIDKINKEMKEFETIDVAEASAFVASTYKENLEANLLDAESIEDESERKQKLKEYTALRSSYTFESYLKVLESHKSIAENTIKDMINPNQVAQVGATYRKKLKSSGTYSNLFGAVHDNIEDSLEAVFLPKEDYAAGYENLFVFGLIRFFSKEDWNNPITKQVHNATVILLSNLVKKNLPEDTQEAIVSGMKQVWGHFLPVVPKK